MPIRLWTNEEDELLTSKYYEMGTDLANEIGRTKKAIVDRAFILKIKTKVTKKTKFCLSCKKKINPYLNKSGYCKKCVAKVNYIKRGMFSHSNAKLWTKEETEYLVNNYYDGIKIDLCKNLNRNFSSISHKAQRLKLIRNTDFIKEGNIRGRNYFINSNPMLNPIFKLKALKSQIRAFSRIKMTSIEKKVANYLKSIFISFDFNKCVKTNKTFRYPDFTIGNLIIECDGEYWHRNRKVEDKARQEELEDLGYKIIRFSEDIILNDFEGVKKCILLELSQLKI